jgi:DNA-binding response OmpR family regulator
VVAVVTGWLAENERRERTRYQQAAGELEKSYQNLQQQSEQLQEIEEQLRHSERLAIMGERAASFAHEVRNPLGAIRGAVEILEDEVPPASPNREFVEVLKSEVSRLNEVIDNYLSLARRAPTSATAFDFANAVQTVMSLVAAAVRRQKIRLRLDLPKAEIRLIADEARFRQVVLNLLLNALAASPPESAIALRGDLQNDGRLLIFSIEDHGAGMTPEVLQQATQPFFATKEHGTGLGLPIAKRMDDESLLKVTAHQLRQLGYEVTAKASGEEGLAAFKESSFAVVVTDLQLPGISSIEVLQEIRRHDRECVVIIITAYGTIENAVKACELGADDYLTKPFSREQLRFVLEKALRLRQLQSENRYLRSELGKHFDFGNIIAKSAAMENVLKMAARIAESEATVLISGESGTGKELLARAIHLNSPRRGQPLITVNHPSIPENLLESELFGHVKGAFTGAMKDHQGKFEQAEGGTIFLDEIGDLKPELQAKLLRVLQEKEIERVGGSKPIKVDVRAIAATNRDLTGVAS